MKKHLYIFLGMTAILMASCKNHEPVADNAVAGTTQVETTESNSDGVQKLVIDPTYSGEEPTSYTLQKVTLEGNIMSIEVSYSGGCEDHDFRLISNQRYMKSMPPQLNLILEHDNHGDACRALIQQTLHFDVSEVKYAGSKSIVLRVNGNREHAVVFEY